MTRAFAAPIVAVDELDCSATSDTVDTVVAVKRIVATDPYLAGHYPQLTIYPGVFSVETVYQAAHAAVRRRFGAHAHAALTRVRSVHFSAPLLPDDVLTATCSLSSSPTDPELVLVTAKCLRADGQTAAKVKLELRVEPTDA